MDSTAHPPPAQPPGGGAIRKIGSASVGESDPANPIDRQADTAIPEDGDNKASGDPFTKSYLYSKLKEIAHDEAFPLQREAFLDGNLTETIANLRIAVKQRLDQTRPPLIDRGIREALSEAEIEAELERAIADAVRERSEQARAAAKLSVNSRSSHSDLKQAQNDWPEPEALPGALPPVPAFNQRLLPEALRPWIDDIGDRAQAPLDYPAAGAIVTLSSALGRRLGIKPKRHDDWLVVPNLWGAIIGPPAFLKSPMLNEILKPLRRLEAKAREDYARELDDYESAREALEAERKKLTVKFCRANSALTRDDLVAELKKLKIEAPDQRRYIVSDPTIEKLGEILNQNPSGVLLFRDELAGWLATLERAGHENDRTFFLESWNGYGSYTYDRIARGTLHIEAVCVSILGAMTPGPLAAYLRETFSGATDDGLIQRFQLSVYPDPPAHWRNVDHWPDTKAKNQAFEVFRRFVSFGSDAPPDEIPSLHFDDGAQEFFDGWRANLETRLRNSPDEHPVMLAHLGKYRSLMPSLALIFDRCDSAAPGVSLEAARCAAAWCDYLESHARRIYHSVTARIDTAARLLGEKIRAKKLANPFTPRDVYRHQWTGLTDPEDTARGLEVLEDLHWLKAEAPPADPGRGRPTMRYRVNPRVWP